VRLRVNPSVLLEWLHLEALGDCVSLWDSLVTLGGCCHLDGLVWRWSSSGGRWLSPAPIVMIVMSSWPFSGGEPKYTLLDWSWLVWSSSCVGCMAPYWGFDVWCQLARESPSECIATTRTSLPASKWISIKKSCVILYEDFISYLVIDCDHLLIGSFVDTSV
jgi:hypothetical protein